MEGVAAGNKRTRAEAEVSTESADAKRMRDDLLDILESGDDRDSAEAPELATFMKHFEEVIGLPASSSEFLELPTDLGYLLEASDDELGLPPASYGGDQEEVQVVEQEGGLVGFDGGWGFEDEVPGSYEFGVWAEGEVEGHEDVVLDGLFDYSDGPGGAGTELLWRAESLTAL